jgi:hypothetical protein
LICSLFYFLWGKGDKVNKKDEVGVALTIKKYAAFNEIASLRSQ